MKSFCEPIASLLEELVVSAGSDLHLAHAVPPQFRVHGKLCLRAPFSCPLTADQVDGLIHSLVSDEEWSRLGESGELDRALDGPGGARLRLNAYRQNGHLAAAIRLLPSAFFPLDKLGIDPGMLENMIALPSGLVLVTGAAGSGKSTTIASILHAINQRRACHIHTIEDPIEYRHKSLKAYVTQREVGRDTEGFGEALRRSLRQDPDIVMVGEMRDLETMRAALTLAETGHLTFATLHTSDAVQTISRVVSAFPAGQQDLAREQLATCLRVVICQQLIPWSKGGGRSLAAEVLWVTPCNQALIRESKTHQMQTTMQTGVKHGMQTRNQALLALVRRQKIAAAAALQYSFDKHSLREELIQQGLCARTQKFKWSEEL
jgi:twitching motility protein PilT